MRSMFPIAILALSCHVYSFQLTSVSSNQSQAAAILPLELSSDAQSYSVVIQTGQINFRVALDTASSDLWIISSACISDSCQQLPRYPVSYHSPTFESVNGNSTGFSVSYVDSTSASGFVAKEEVTLGNLTIRDQAFALITNSNVSFVDQTSGILGLGFPRLSSIPSSVTSAVPFFGRLAQQGLLRYPLFGLSLTLNASGTLALGAIDGSVVKNLSEIEWHKVVEFPPISNESNTSSYLSWVIPLTGISINGTHLQPSPTYKNAPQNASLALLDIGTSGLYGPYQDVSRLYSLIEDARLVSEDGQWAVSCDTDIQISFAFGGQNFTLQPTDYLIGPAQGNPNLCLSWPKALPPSPDAIDWQLGIPFLRTVYTIFDYGIDDKEPPMVGFYPLQNASLAESEEVVSSYFSSLSATIPTTLPNFLLPTPTFTTPPYGFNSSVKVDTKGIVTSALATSTYDPIFGKHTNLSAIPIVTPTPSLMTFIVTESSGVISTSVSTSTPMTVTLGVPPGWSATSIASIVHVPTALSLGPCLLLSTLLLL